MKLTLIRGIPGSGKSTMARSLGCFHLEADMFHVRDGEYKYDANARGAGHLWCQRMCEEALKSGFDVVVSNTFITNKEMVPYKAMARDYGATLEVLVAKGNFKDVHGVPQEVLDRMRANFEE